MAQARPFRMPCSHMHRVTLVLAATRHAYPRHSHDTFGIGLFDWGAQRSSSGRGMVEAGPGMLVTVNPGEVHCGSPIGDGERAWRMLYLEPGLIAQAGADIREGAGGDAEFARPVLCDPRLAPWFEYLFKAAAGDLPPLAGEEALLVLAAGLMVCGPDRPALPAPIHAARARIDDDPAAPVTLAELAVLTGLSRFQVLRGFAAATGLTPHAYLMQRRLHLARRLIAAGTPLAQAAADAGFADQSHMTRLFTRCHGVTPAAYARAIR